MQLDQRATDIAVIKDWSFVGCRFNLPDFDLPNIPVTDNITWSGLVKKNTLLITKTHSVA